MGDSAIVVDADEMLVVMIQEGSILYDESLSEYKNKDKKRDAWNEIASNMFIMTETPTEGTILTCSCNLKFIKMMML